MPGSLHAQLITVVPCHNTLGENALWHAQDNKVYWIDIEQAQLLSYCPTQAVLQRYPLPERIGSFAFLAPTPNCPYLIIAAFASGIALYHPETHAIKWLFKPSNMTGLRFNDGRADRQGRFWAGTMVEDSKQAHKAGELYQLNEQLQAISRLQEITISNGLCWSPDGKIMYHADSAKHCITQYAFDVVSGALSQGQVFAVTPENAFPDGAIVDAQAYVWCAHWGAGEVVRYDVHGQAVFSLPLPVSQPSSVAIGGVENNLLFVTTSKVGLSAEQKQAEPEAGNLFIYQIQNLQGLPEPLVTLPTTLFS